MFLLISTSIVGQNALDEKSLNFLGKNPKRVQYFLKKTMKLKIFKKMIKHREEVI